MKSNYKNEQKLAKEKNAVAVAKLESSMKKKLEHKLSKLVEQSQEREIERIAAETANFRLFKAQAEKTSKDHAELRKLTERVQDKLQETIRQQAVVLEEKLR